MLAALSTGARAHSSSPGIPRAGARSPGAAGGGRLPGSGEPRGSAGRPKSPGKEKASAGVSAVQQDTARRSPAPTAAGPRAAAAPGVCPRRAGQRAGGTPRGGRPLTAAPAPSRSWNACTCPGTASAGCIPWGPYTAQLSFRYREAPQGKAVGLQLSCPGRGLSWAIPRSLPSACITPLDSQLPRAGEAGLSGHCPLLAPSSP